MLVALLGSLLVCNRANAPPDSVLAAPELAFAGAHRIPDVLAPDLRVRATRDSGRGERGRPHEAHRDRCDDDRSSKSASPRWTGRSNRRAIWRAGRYGGRAERNEASTELILQPEVEFVPHRVVI